MLNERLSERGQKIEEALKEVRERAGRGGSGREEKEENGRKLRELREKVGRCLGFAYQELGMDGRVDDPNFLLDNAQKIFDDMISLHHSEKAVHKE